MGKTYLGKLGEPPVVFIMGAVAYWWDTDEYQHWNTPEHWHYVAWRERVNDALVEAGYLVYRHWEAFKGTWNNRMQRYNSLILSDSDFLINIKPDFAWSDGTDEEIRLAAENGQYVIMAPPPATEAEFSWAIKNLLEELAARQ
jgi:hypothetical protein